MMEPYLLLAFTAVVIGGLTSLSGVWVGGIVVGIVNNVVSLYGTSDLATFVIFALLLALFVRDHRWFALVFLFSAVGNAGIGTAAWNLLYAIAPANERALYIGLVNSVLALPSLAPVAAGALVILLGLPVLFGVGLGFAVVAMVISLRVRELHQLDQAALKPKASAAVQEILEEAKAVAGDADTETEPAAKG